MDKKVKRLGRGLDSLIPRSIGESIPPDREPDPKADSPPKIGVSQSVAKGKGDGETEKTQGVINRTGEKSTAMPTPPGGASAKLPTGNEKAAGTPIPRGQMLPPENDHGQSGVEAAMVPVGSLTPNPHQPRMNMPQAELDQLATSIRTSGMIQPVIVRRNGSKLEIVAGERRWRAAKLIGMSTIPVVIRSASDEQMLEWALVENIQREDLNPVDRAQAYREFCDRFRMSAEQVASRVGEDRTTVVNYIRILDLPQPVKDLLVAKKISMGHARSLLGIKNDAIKLRLAEAAARNELSVRALEEIARRDRELMDEARERASNPPVSPRLRTAHVKDLERKFEAAVKTRVQIFEGKRRGTGRIVMEYFSLADFERIADMLGVELE